MLRRNEAADLFQKEIDGAKREEVLDALAGVIAPGHAEIILRASRGDVGSAFRLPELLGGKWLVTLKESKDLTWTCSLERPTMIDALGNINRFSATSFSRGRPDVAMAILEAYLEAIRLFWGDDL